MSKAAAFADRLIAAVRSFNTPLCVGIDPFPDLIPALFGDAHSDARALARFGEAILEIAAKHTGVFKPQLGLFEPYGPEGVAIAAELTTLAKTKNLAVILDAKRGDPLFELVEVLHIEAEMIDGASLGRRELSHPG